MQEQIIHTVKSHVLVSHWQNICVIEEHISRRQFRLNFIWPINTNMRIIQSIITI